MIFLLASKIDTLALSDCEILFSGSIAAISWLYTLFIYTCSGFYRDILFQSYFSSGNCDNI